MVFMILKKILIFTNIKYHLGNARVTYNKNMQIVDTNNYYPFGMNHLRDDAPSNFEQGSYKNYKYNGKELQEMGVYDYGARFYMSEVGRWGVVDPLAEKMPNLNPYNLYDASNYIWGDWMNYSEFDYTTVKISPKLNEEFSDAVTPKSYT